MACSNFFEIVLGVVVAAPGWVAPQARVNRHETDDELRARIERLSDATSFAFG